MNILITGGASGVGEAITRHLCASQANQVYFTYFRSGEKAKKITEDFSNAISVHCDFEKESDIRELEINLPLFNLDALVHNAYQGDFITNHFHKLNNADFEKSFSVNIMPLVRITREAIKLFRKKRSGKIVNILSAVLVNKPPIGAAVYTAVKAFHESLSKSWATENAAFGITSNCILPAMMKTNLTSTIDERVIEQVVANHPLKELLPLAEVARAVAYFLSASSHVNGTSLVLNAAADIN
jgi:3-oxoacyl-[acyl-carrier protein] reductase